MNLDELRDELLDARARVRAMLEDLGQSFDDIVMAAQDSNLDDEHDPEGSTIAADRSLVSSMAQTAATRLAEIDDALLRIDAGTYGRCLSCNEEIPELRLQARPTATRCLTCAS